MKYNRKHHRKTAVLWALGLTSLLLAGCNNATEPSASNTASSTVAQNGNQTMPEVVMYKPPTCDCCTGWAEHLQRAGFKVVVHKRDDMDVIKARHGVSRKLASCHTAIVDGYVIEGHVPAEDVARLLKERPDVVGLTAPGMPQKAPGMQTPGLPARGYDVLAFDKSGATTLFHRY